MVQIVNTHLPSSIGHSIDELDDILRQVDGILGGKRHIGILMGDFNTELTSATSDAFIGTAIRTTPSRTTTMATRPSPHATPPNEHQESITTFLRGRGLVALNTHSKWWRDADDPHNCTVTTPLGTA